MTKQHNVHVWDVLILHTVIPETFGVCLSMARLGLVSDVGVSEL